MSIGGCSLLTLPAWWSTITVVLVASCFSPSSSAQRSALHRQETRVQLDNLAKVRVFYASRSTLQT